MSMLWLLLELWQFSFIKDRTGIQISEIPRSASCSLHEDWVELRIPNLAKISLLNSYCMLKNARVAGFVVSKLVRENNRGKTTTPPHPPSPRNNWNTINTYRRLHETVTTIDCFWLKSKTYFKKVLVIPNNSLTWLFGFLSINSFRHSNPHHILTTF